MSLTCLPLTLNVNAVGPKTEKPDTINETFHR